MYRKQSGKLGFSFNRLVTNAVPNFANSADIADLSLKEQDDLFKFQLSQANPRVLSELSFHIVGIVENMSQSPKVLASLKQASILSSHPDDPTVYTSRITKHFSNQMATISIHRQRKLVVMLFFWEEELMRWKLLDDEKDEILGILASSADDADNPQEEELRIALSRVQAKKNMKPSMRLSDGTDHQEHQLPEYGQGAGSVDVYERQTGHATTSN